MNPEYVRKRNCIAVVPVITNNTKKTRKDKINKFAVKTKSQISTNIKSAYKTVIGGIIGLTEYIPAPNFNLPKVKRQKKHIPLNIIKNKLQDIISRCFISLLSTALLLIALFTVFSTYYTPCYEFIVNGNSIGFSTDKAAFSTVVSEINSELISTFGENSIINKSADTIIRIIKKDNLTSNNDFYSSVAALSEFMINADVLSINGVDKIGFRTEGELNDAIETFTSNFSSENSEVTILEEISTEKKYVPATMVYTVESAQNYLSNENCLTIKAVTPTTYTEQIDYSKSQIEDNTMYSDQSEVVQAGQFGTKTISAMVTTVNGVETEKVILSDIVTTQPVEEVIKIGTKRRPIGIGSGDFLFPSSGTISSRYGARWGKQHKGLDIANTEGTEILAADEGVVTFSGVKTGYGNVIILDHKNGYQTYYAHCSSLSAQVGDIVGKGDVIAYMGNTGNSTGSHLHFEVRKNGITQDPENYVTQK